MPDWIAPSTVMGEFCDQKARYVTVLVNQPCNDCDSEASGPRAKCLPGAVSLI